MRYLFCLPLLAPMCRKKDWKALLGPMAMETTFLQAARFRLFSSSFKVTSFTENSLASTSYIDSGRKMPLPKHDGFYFGRKLCVNIFRQR